MSSPIPPVVLKIDSENYMVSGSAGPRPRSYSFTNGVSRPADSSYHRQHAETANSLARSLHTFSPLVAKPPSPTDVVVSTPAGNCARTLSFHGVLCFCRLSCCCVCDSLCPPDCHACVNAVHYLDPKKDIPPPSPLHNKVSHGFTFNDAFSDPTI
ncbi:hypothetical protein AAG570_013047 [Ranatra chinensis]|uniref:Uncharacterized protein n=1 Tax=Ranatra chinensis TaxID=642074 RepID=A0ABD0YY35_9HEMI